MKMNRKSVWLIISCLVVLALLLASCGPAAVEEEGKTVVGKVVEREEKAVEEKEEVVAKEKEMVRDSLGRLVPKPEYGGVLTYSIARDPLGFDEALGVVPWSAYALHLTNQELLQPDWTKGPSGTGEGTLAINAVASVNDWTGCLAESWELSDPDTIVLHLRKDVYWQNKPPVNGRQFTSDDVVYSINRNFETKTAYLRRTYKEGQRPLSVTAPDKWTVVIECPAGFAGEIMEACGEICRIVASEVIDAYGDMRDWKNVVGTGPFILTDYVSGGSLRFDRNPSFWMTDPFHPENKLPYLDGVNMLVIQDASTRLAALRTGKIAALAGISWEDRDILRESHPHLEETRVLAGSPYCIFMRTDTEPFDDIRIRRALAMGLDQAAIRDELYGGNAEIQSFPVAAISEFKDCYTPLEELPESTRELFEYHPDKAKELLAEAGYPDGFKTSMVLFSAPALTDIFAVVKDQWSKIGVDLELDVKEYAVWHSVCVSHTHKQMTTRYMSATIPFKMYHSRPGTTQNMSIIDDPYINENFEKITAAYFDDSVRNPLMKEVAKYILDQCWMIQLPAPYSYVMWHPWLHGFHGEVSAGRNNLQVWPMFTWLDLDMKYEMTGVR